MMFEISLRIANAFPDLEKGFDKFVKNCLEQKLTNKLSRKRNAKLQTNLWKDNLQKKKLS